MRKRLDDSDRREAAERKWLGTYTPKGRVSGQYLFPIPEHVYEPAGGFKNLKT